MCSVIPNKTPQTVIETKRKTAPCPTPLYNFLKNFKPASKKKKKKNFKPQCHMSINSPFPQIFFFTFPSNTPTPSEHNSPFPLNFFTFPSNTPNSRQLTTRNCAARPNRPSTPCLPTTYPADHTRNPSALPLKSKPLYKPRKLTQSNPSALTSKV